MAEETLKKIETNIVDIFFNSIITNLTIDHMIVDKYMY